MEVRGETIMNDQIDIPWGGDNDNGNKKSVCPECGKKSIEYSYAFSKHHAVFLGSLYEAGGIAKTDDLDLTYPQRTNSQKLRYWGLAIPYLKTDEATQKRGWWEITRKGKDFVEGKISIPEKVLVRDNVVLKLYGVPKMFYEADEGYKFRRYYQGVAARFIEENE